MLQLVDKQLSMSSSTLGDIYQDGRQVHGLVCQEAEVLTTKTQVMIQAVDKQL